MKKSGKVDKIEKSEVGKDGNKKFFNKWFSDKRRKIISYDFFYDFKCFFDKVKKKLFRH